MKTGFRVEKNSLLAGLINHGIMYPTPLNLNYFWSFGSAAGILLVFQILTGIFLSMHYVADINLAFNSVEHIMRDVNNGWLIRYMHANGASMFLLSDKMKNCVGIDITDEQLSEFNNYKNSNNKIYLKSKNVFVKLSPIVCPLVA